MRMAARVVKVRGAVATVKEAARAEAVLVDVEARMVQEVAAVAMAAVLAFTWACLPFRSASLADCWPWSSALASPSGLGRCGVAGACPGCVRLCLPWLCEPLL